jgi:hypothetical protein
MVICAFCSFFAALFVFGAMFTVFEAPLGMFVGTSGAINNFVATKTMWTLSYFVFLAYIYKLWRAIIISVLTESSLKMYTALFGVKVCKWMFRRLLYAAA